MKNFLRASVVLFIFTLFLAGCSKDSGSNPVNDNTNNQNTNTGTSWKTETISPSDANGEYPQIAVNSSGNPSVAYLDVNDGYLKYAEKNGTSWNISKIEYIADVQGAIANRGICSLALDAQGNPHVCFMSANGFDPSNGSGNVRYRYAKRIGGTWTIQDITMPDDPDMPYQQVYSIMGDCSIAVDQSTGIAHIAMYMWGRYGGVLGYWNSNSKTVVVVDKLQDTDPGEHNSIAIDGRGYPGISYQAKTTGVIKFAQWNGSAFNIETIGSMSENYWESMLTSLAYDASNNPHIAYIDGSDYKYAHKSGSTWNIEPIPCTSGYPSLSISIDPSNKPHFAIMDGYIIKHATWDGKTWTTETISKDGEKCDIAVDKTGKVHMVICVNPDGTGIIKYAVK